MMTTNTSGLNAPIAVDLNATAEMLGVSAKTVMTEPEWKELTAVAKSRGLSVSEILMLPWRKDTK